MSACSLQIILSRSSVGLPNGENVDLEILLHEEQSSHASRPTRLRQLSTFASSSAKSFLPMPSSPVKSNDPGSRPSVNRRRSVFFTSSLPISLENILPLAQDSSLLQKGHHDAHDRLLSFVN